jgi:hypothetical protein
MSEWKRYKLSDLYEMSSGISSTKEQAGHGSPFLSFSVVFNNYFLPDSLIDLMDTTDGDKQKYSINEGDIFLTRTSETVDELAMSSVALKDYPEASFSGFLKRLRPVDKRIVYPKFMAFYLRSPLFRRTIINNTVMTLRASFNEAMFSYLEIMLPDFDTQKKIGDFLYSLEKKKQTNNQINQELEAMAKTLYDYWFVQFDFPDQNGKPYKSSGGKMVYNQELKREIPEGWEVENLFNVAEVQYGYPFSTDYFNSTGEGVPVIRIRDILGNDTTNYSTEEVEDKYKINVGDVLIGMDGNFHMNYWIKEDCYLNQRVVKVNSDKLPNMVLKYQIEPFIKLREKSVSRTTVGHLSDKDLKAINVILPKEKYLSPIFERFENILKNIIINQQQNQELTQLRDWLLPMLMNGQVKVE